MVWWKKNHFWSKIEIKSTSFTLKKIHELADTNDLKFDFNGINKLKNLVNDFSKIKKFWYNTALIIIDIISSHLII